MNSTVLSTRLKLLMTPLQARRFNSFTALWITAVKCLFGCIASCVLQCSVCGDDVKLLSCPRDAFLRRVELIQAATREIYLSTYELGDGPLTLSFLAELQSAAERGVDVRILVDGHDGLNLLPKPLQQCLRASGVQLREFNVDDRYFVDLGRARLHAKMLVVDGTHLVTGGRNIRDRYFGLDGQNYFDRDVCLSGDSAAAARCCFLSYWNDERTGVPDLTRAETSKTLKSQLMVHLNIGGNRVERSSAVLRESTGRYTQLLDQHIQTSQQMHPICEVDNVQLWCDQPGCSKTGPSSVSSRYLATLGSARTSLLIESPYFVISKDLMHVIANLRDRNVCVRVVTNSLGSTDQIIAHAGYANQRIKLRSLGVHLYEWTGPEVLHAKVVVIDGTRCLLGSYNADILSEKRNYEMVVCFDSPELGLELTRLLQQDMARSRSVPAGLLWNFDAETGARAAERMTKFRSLRLVAPALRRFL